MSYLHQSVNLKIEYNKYSLKVDTKFTQPNHKNLEIFFCS